MTGSSPVPRALIDLLLLGLLTVAMCTTLLRWLHAGDRTRRQWAALVSGAASVVLVARWLRVVPTIGSPRFEGYAVLDALSHFPFPAMVQRHAGEAGFVILGAVSWLSRFRFEWIAGTNQAFSVAALACVGWLVARWTGRRRAALFVLAAGALHVGLARPGASLDFHPLATLLGCVSVLGFELYAETRQRSALAMGALALVLMADTRLTLLCWVPGIVAIALWRARASGGVSRELLFGLALGLLGVGLRFGESLRADAQGGFSAYQFPYAVFLIPRAVELVSTHHPILGVRDYSPVVAGFALVGIVVAVRRKLWAPLIGLTLLPFLAVLPFGGINQFEVQLPFRYPSTLLFVAWAGVGAEALVALCLSWSRALGGVAAVAVAVFLVVSPESSPAGVVLRRASADTAEYDFVRTAARTLPAQFTLREPHFVDGTVGSGIPWTAFLEAGVDVKRAGPEASPGPELFLEGLNCYAYSFKELFANFDLRDHPAVDGPHGSGTGAPAPHGEPEAQPGEPRDTHPGPGEILGKLSPAEKRHDDEPPPYAVMARFFPKIIERDLPELHIPVGLRPECAELLAGAAPPSGPEIILEHPSDWWPDHTYSVQSIPVRFRTLASPRLRADPGTQPR